VLVLLQPLTGREPREMLVDGAVADLGNDANAEAARDAGLEIDPATGGVMVDEHLRASDPRIFAAGDVAAFDNRALESRVRIENEDNAVQMGEHAGRNMARARLGHPLEAYDYVPSYTSSLFGVQYDAVGLVAARLSTVTDWHKTNEQGVTYYLEDGRVRGVLLWNLPDQVEAARCLIAEPGPFDPVDLHGRLPEKPKPEEAASLFKEKDGNDY
jgi:NADPH-dependent 2,4-dienoyl-CoA reductase/sulfur reductase-like enzyme